MVSIDTATTAFSRKSISVRGRRSDFSRSEKSRPANGSVTSPDDVARAVASVDQIYHLAGMVSHKAADAHRMYAVHVDGTRLVCEAAARAGVTRIVMAGRSEPLDVGRRTAIVSPALRRAVIARDRRCRFPGCDRPPGWCDVHHVIHWINGGPTRLWNLVLLCRRHHRLIHTREGFTLVLEHDRPVFRRADGTILVDRAPP